MPLVYWLSGLTCTDENFVTKAGAQRYAAQLGLAIVAPDTSPRGEGVPDDPEGAWDFGLGAGFYVNATQEPWRRHYRMYDYIVDELPALVSAGFPVDSSRTGISGHSMGGHGALTIALKNPGRFQVGHRLRTHLLAAALPLGRESPGQLPGPGPGQLAAVRRHGATGRCRRAAAGAGRPGRCGQFPGRAAQNAAAGAGLSGGRLPHDHSHAGRL